MLEPTTQDVLFAWDADEPVQTVRMSTDTMTPMYEWAIQYLTFSYLRRLTRNPPHLTWRDTRELREMVSNTDLERSSGAGYSQICSALQLAGCYFNNGYSETLNAHGPSRITTVRRNAFQTQFAPGGTAVRKPVDYYPTL